MKKIAVISGILLPLCVAGTAQTVEKQTASKPYYVSLKIGGTIPRDLQVSGITISLDNGVNGAAAVGLQLQPTVRLELEGSYRKVDFDKMSGDMTVKTLMANAYYDFPVDGTLKPYLMGGIGMARLGETQQFLILFNDTGGAYQLGGGLSYTLSEAVTADVGYRYLGVRAEGDDLGFHEFLAGLRFGF